MEKIIFSKYSNERGDQFALRTDICKKEDGTKCVHKKAIYPAGASHVRNINSWYERLADIYRDSQIRINRCSLTEEGAELEYLEGNTLEHILDAYLAQGNVQQTVDILMEYLEEVKKGFTLAYFQKTPEFVQTFGNAEIPQNLLCGSIVDIDMVTNNILVNHGWTLIDYEWTFAFPIPYHFVAYRILSYYIGGSNLRDCLRGYGLMERMGITPQEEVIYEKMETYFQETYVLGNVSGEKHMPLRLLYEQITPGTIDLKTSVDFNEEMGRESRMVQLYQSAGEPFSEERSELQELQSEGICLNTFRLENETRQIRLDPASRYCVIRKLQMVWGSRIRRYRTNGIELQDGSILFPLDDPQIIIDRPGDGDDVFRVYYEIEYLTVVQALDMLRMQQGKLHGQLMQAREVIRQRDARIKDMENTKVWKAYRKCRGVVARED